MLSVPIYSTGNYTWWYSHIKGHISTVLLFSTLGLCAQESDFENQVVVEKLPVPNEKKQLFYLQRDPDENTVVYQLNLTDNKINVSKPVNVYWIRYAQGGERRELNFIQRTMAYGVSHERLDSGDFELRLAAYKSLPLKLTYCEKSKRHVVVATINDREAVLERVFVRIQGGSPLNPDIAYFELNGHDVSTNAPVMERIIP